MGFMSKLNAPVETATDEQRLKFMIQAIRVLLVCIKQLNHLPPEVEDQRYRKAIDHFNEVIGQEKALAGLQKAFVGCRTAVLAHSQVEKHYLKKKEMELREIISVLVRNFTVFNDESNGNLSELERCTEQLEVARNLDDLSTVRKVLSGQVDLMRQKLVQQRQQQGLLLSQMNDQITVLNTNLGRSEKAAMTDALTGAGNRRGLDKALKQRIDDAVMKEKGFAVLIWDVDNFKKLNDKYGHLVGDGVLKTLVKQCYRMIRGGDYIGRYGGEEFVIILEEVDAKMAARRGRDIVKTVAGLDIMLNGISRAHRLQSTVSMGVSEFRPGDSAESLLERADKALYEAKKRGKNRCELAP